MSIGLFGGNIKMKVLQINTVCGRGSTGRIATDINKLLLEQGHESVIAYGRGVKVGNIFFYIYQRKSQIILLV